MRHTASQLARQAFCTCGGPLLAHLCFVFRYKITWFANECKARIPTLR